VDLDTIKNFVVISHELATAGQPSETELAALKASGFAAVVNLGLLDPKYCLPDEAGTTAGLGLEYHHIPVDFKAPALADFARFAQVMRGLSGKRTFVHCAMNFRVACFVALYGEAELGWSRERADAHIRRLWQPNEAWQAFLGQVRATLP
jgi:protein tyrosine phosphatase (PTP) superfamily phosphohydrolase (DUF442 family)